jgi:hypothetical protein
MKTADLFILNRSSKRLNESMFKTFGRKLNLESFSLEQLEDARNKLRTQIYQVRNNSNFNENVENDALSQAQFMLDAIVAEIAERENIVNLTQVEGFSSEAEELLAAVVQSEDFDQIYALHRKAGKPGAEGVAGNIIDDMYWEAAQDLGAHGDDDFEEIYDLVFERLLKEYGDSDADQQEDLTVEKAPPGAKAERIVKHIKKGYAKNGKLTDKERSIAYATAWKQHNKEKHESIETGEDMKNLQEGEIQQASAIVSAKTMVDRVGRWIEELSGMENDTLLQLGDSIRDEMGQEQAKNFISTVAPAIQSALDTLKTARETLASSVRALTGEEQAAGMLGAEPTPAVDSDMNAGPDAMNTEPDAGVEDEFAAAEPAAGGMEASGREQRESIDRQNRLLKVLAG